jgi:hypothetical protein
VLGRPDLAGQGRLVQDGDARDHDPVHGNHVTGGHQDQVAGRDLRQRHDFHPVAAGPARGLRGPVEQCAQIMPGARRRPRLQGPPAGQHDADDRGGQQLADGDRARQREQRDHVHAETTAANAGGGGPQGIAQPAGRRRQPGRVRDPARAGQGGHSPRDEASGSQAKQQDRRSPAQPGGRGTEDAFHLFSVLAAG